MDEAGKWAVGKRLAVFCIREGKMGSVWVRAGAAFVNRDGSLNVLLDVLPLDGKLHVREAVERKEGASSHAPASLPAPELIRDLSPERTPAAPLERKHKLVGATP